MVTWVPSHHKTSSQVYPSIRAFGGELRPVLCHQLWMEGQDDIIHISLISNSYLTHISSTSHSYITHITLISHSYHTHITLISHSYITHITLIYHSYHTHISLISHSYHTHITLISHSYHTHVIHITLMSSISHSYHPYHTHIIHITLISHPSQRAESISSWQPHNSPCHSCVSDNYHIHPIMKWRCVCMCGTWWDSFDMKMCVCVYVYMCMCVYLVR